MAMDFLEGFALGILFGIIVLSVFTFLYFKPEIYSFFTLLSKKVDDVHDRIDKAELVIKDLIKSITSTKNP